MTSAEKLRRGQHVTINLDGAQVKGVVFRQASARDQIDLAEVPGRDIGSVIWVRRLDTKEIEGFLNSDLIPEPEPDVRISIGRPTEVVHEDRVDATKTLAEEIRLENGVSVTVEVVEREEGLYGLGPIEWTAIFIGSTVATTLITNLTNDLYAKAKQMLLSRKKGRPNRGFVIYGPDGKVLKRWDNKNGDRDEGED